ncbi:MAG: DUF2971 domain-containing protein [Colwellia sp.]
MSEELKPDQLCHYTSVGGLMGIVDDEAIWATQSLYLNDYKEIKHGAQLLHNQLYQYEVSKEHDKIVFATELNHLVNNIDTHAKRVYITSFSNNDNQLSQWRGYTPANKGVSITFNLDIIFRLVDANPEMFLVPCLYDVDDNAKNSMDEILGCVDLCMKFTQKLYF